MAENQSSKRRTSMLGEKNPMYHNGYKIAGEKNGMYGKHHTEETRAKMKEAAKHKNMSGKNNPTYGSKHPNSRQPIQYNMDGSIAHIYESMEEAQRDGFYKQQVRHACLKHNAYKGYKWAYSDEVEGAEKE